jgi:hypothetical protein
VVEGWREGLRIGFESHAARIGQPRARATLPRQHPYANSAGWQYLARFLVMEALGDRLETAEHVHHDNGHALDDRLDNYLVLGAAYHGRLEATRFLIAERHPDGRFKRVEYVGGTAATRWAPRFGAVIGSAAADLLELYRSAS